MAHDIHFDVKTGRHSFAYTGQPGWHGLGQCVTQGAGIDQWVKESGFDFTILRQAVSFAMADGKTGYYPERHVLYRDDTGAPLSIVSDRYQILQPSQIAEWFDKLCKAYGFSIETMGVLRDGSRYFALARTNNAIDIDGDQLLTYLVIATSCDGTLKTKAFFTSVRVVCQNTLSMAYRNEGKSSVSYSHRSEFNPAQAEKDLNLQATAFSDDLADNILLLSQQPMSEAENLVFISDALNIDMGTPTAAKVLELCYLSPGSDLSAANNTLWGTVNAYSYFIDHGRNYREEDTRLESAILTGQSAKAEFFQKAIDYAALKAKAA